MLRKPTPGLHPLISYALHSQIINSKKAVRSKKKKTYNFFFVLLDLCSLNVQGDNKIIHYTKQTDLHINKMSEPKIETGFVMDLKDV